VREAARGNGSLERRDRAPDRLHHRLFSHISTNWRGRPLVSHEVIVDLIGATTTRTGLTVRAELDSGAYPNGIKVADKELAAVPIPPACIPRGMELHDCPRYAFPAPVNHNVIVRRGLRPAIPPATMLRVPAVR